LRHTAAAVVCAVPGGQTPLAARASGM
jgi:hypothetical protein